MQTKQESKTYRPTHPLGEVERFGFGFKINKSIPFFKKESQIVLPLVLRLDSYLRYFEMTYKNILQKFYEKPITKIPKSFFIFSYKINKINFPHTWHQT